MRKLMLLLSIFLSFTLIAASCGDDDSSDVTTDPGADDGDDMAGDDGDDGDDMAEDGDDMAEDDMAEEDGDDMARRRRHGRRHGSCRSCVRYRRGR